jgi:hypothetical protein
MLPLSKPHPYKNELPLHTFFLIYSASCGFETKSVAHTVYIRMVGCVVNNEVVRICKEAVVGYFYVLFCPGFFLEGLKHETRQSLWSVSRPEFEPITFRKQVRSATVLRYVGQLDAVVVSPQGSRSLHE